MKVFNPILVVILTLLSSLFVNAQDTAQNEPKILLSGKVNCVDPVNGTLSSVVVFNINKGFGTVSDKSGSFSINMAKNDTIIFSTAEHKDFYYFIEPEVEFEDHSIEVIMVTDAIWLNAVTIMGHQSLEKFKREILSQDIPQGDTKLALPIVNKYAKQLATGDGETDLVGPLTYLQNKFDRYYKMRRQVTKDMNTNKK